MASVDEYVGFKKIFFSLKENGTIEYHPYKRARTTNKQTNKMKVQCSGIKKDGKPCGFNGKFITGTKHFCKHHVPKSAPEPCSICMNNLSCTQEATTLKCKHAFHTECMTSWTKSCHERGNDATCPLCREVTEEHSRQTYSYNNTYNAIIAHLRATNNVEALRFIGLV
jgi:hypothetical protein